MTYVLGISCYYHDSSAALLKDGTIVAAAEEERFTRIKHDSSFPMNAIEYCLKQENITIKEINFIGFYEKPLIKYERILSQIIETFPLSLKIFLKNMPSWLTEKLKVVETIKKKLKYKGNIFFIEHHLAHAASCFLVSPFEKAAIFTIDGVGEWTTTSYGTGNKNQIHLMKEIKFPNSIGLLYSTITGYLGFKVNNSEFKVMGLSAFGNTDKKTNPYYKKLEKVIEIKEDGSYKLNLDYFSFHYADKMPSKKLCKLLDGKIRKPGTELTEKHKDIAAALQLITEEVITKILNQVYNETKCENIVLAGGVALNSVSNGKILKNTQFKNIWIQPAASDAGTSIGTANYIFNSILGNKRNYEMTNAFLGPEFSTQEIKNFFEENKIKYSEFKNEKEIIKTTAKLIYENKIVSWFQGRMEFGPRALGNRSILANPCNPEMQNILNKKVKHREPFRPFAPAVCSEDASKYFEVDNPIPKPTDFMLMVYPVKKEFKKKLPAVTHINGTARPQTINREQNNLYYDLIKEFGKLSGISVLVNTSFNVNGEPIVCTPLDAFNCMMRTGIDFLVIDKFLVKREDNIVK
ncbi:MAG: hypothetical protein COT90_01755 [Candidatus Diapherotrites archaeon CG10_big_fil_rev_8_21_14_0_10_31_34]|nr:MAG: hypothetical protein COT90_01755 [Candidatus Diapherotrites archaeon CG10_big_fil_rev_8_21_14_0_10_31_34]